MTHNLSRIYTYWYIKEYALSWLQSIRVVGANVVVNCHPRSMIKLRGKGAVVQVVKDRPCSTAEMACV